MTISIDSELDFYTRLLASNEAVAHEMSRRSCLIEQLAEDVTYPEPATISFIGSAATPLVSPKWGPGLGFTWFMQLITVGPLASGDTLALYRGFSQYDNQAQRKKIEWVGTNGTWQTWVPGRTGFRLTGAKDGTLLFDGGSGSLTSATRYTINADVIQVADRSLALFLM